MQANTSGGLPPLKDAGRPRPIVHIQQRGNIVGVFPLVRRILAITGGSDVWNEATRFQWEFPHNQFQVQPVCEGRDGFSALLVREDTVAEVIPYSSTYARHDPLLARVYAPKQTQAWVVLQAAEGNCWVNGSFLRAQYKGGRITPAFPISLLPDVTWVYTPQWDASTFDQEAKVLPGAAGDVVDLVAVTDMSPSARPRVFLTTACEEALKDGQKWTAKYPTTGTLRACQRNPQATSLHCRTLCVPVGAAAKVTEHRGTRLYHSLAHVLLIQLPQGYEWSCID
ncbi:hypothetical protein P389DRAFT_14303 [Cystobasidium minutum MCA 4210]|uniref:uncharacterized protein n=1 Tax=Cystobasidium minutum MCA 4210 TaxID=1397322 RepID=UPI0034CD14C6|eukprot:jgi/Rhomi1/14303/CE14302_283